MAFRIINFVRLLGRHPIQSTICLSHKHSITETQKHHSSHYFSKCRQLCVGLDTPNPSEPVGKIKKENVYYQDSILVSDILAKKPAIGYYSCFQDDLVFKAVEQMVVLNIGSLVVLKSKEEPIPVGIVTERDYLQKIIVKDRSSKSTPVKTIMSTNLLHVEPSQDLVRCMQLMTQNRIRHIPVITSDNQLKGMLSIGDVVKTLLAMHEKREHAMSDYIAGTY